MFIQLNLEQTRDQSCLTLVQALCSLQADVVISEPNSGHDVLSIHSQTTHTALSAWHPVTFGFMC